MTTTAEKIAIMQAYVEGKKLDYKHIYHKSWEPFTNLIETEPVWNWYQYEYRISPNQPKPKTLFKCYLIGTYLYWIKDGEDIHYKNSSFYPHIPSEDKEVELP